MTNITCDNCGACCRHMGYPPFLMMYDYDASQGDPQWLALPRNMAMQIRQGAVDGRGDKELPCIWYDEQTRRCKHYDRRPDICHEFEVGDEPCLKFRELYQIGVTR